MKYLKICIICAFIGLFLMSCETKPNNNNFDINNLIQSQYKFTQGDIPSVEELYKLNSEYDVDPFLTKKENKLIINDRTSTPIKSFTIYENNEIGSLIAGNYGEFGKYLYYISVHDLYEINTVANDFYVLNDDPETIYHDTVYCVYGFAHGAFEEGKITRITKIDRKWQKDESFEIDLEDCIDAFYVEDDTVYVVTSNKLIKIKNNKIEKVLVEDSFWYLLYPSSIVGIDDILYIGMRGGIASYDLNTGELLWYEKAV